MLNEQNLVVMLKLFLFILFPLLQIEASVRSGKGKASLQNDEIHKGQSSNQISVEEEKKQYPEEQQIYYLPSQTEFGTTITATLRGVSSTSPPHLTIQPAPIQTSYQDTTDIFSKDSSAIKEHYSSLLPSQCVSETPVTELESRFLRPSRDTIKESVIMSGHLEIASKTSSIEEVTDIGNIVSKPSIALEGTVYHSHSTADL